MYLHMFIYIYIYSYMKNFFQGRSFLNVFLRLLLVRLRAINYAFHKRKQEH